MIRYSGPEGPFSLAFFQLYFPYHFINQILYPPLYERMRNWLHPPTNTIMGISIQLELFKRAAADKIIEDVIEHCRCNGYD